MPEKGKGNGTEGSVRRRIAFDGETYHALHQLALDRTASLQELADEAFRDLLKKYHRPVGIGEMLRQSARLLPSNDRVRPKRPR